ncbi:hypothetical protein ACFSTE_13555 [Aquimarina hainanensis]|uniref:Type II secretion system protein n=1 Tax=Aquimarina hainanensis TaxID=1578017 RepID=A0ABW5N8H9_9FLAO|nr:hypothetical protein [Aquimarina sp. TRL1]QKX04087.1 hypothetical protein HN014_03910 [Aquimarina sp. TRL1]
MVVLKKIRAATLIEALTASVLIIIVFMVASLSFNNIFNNQIRQDHSPIENRVKELEYLFIHQKIKLPYTEDFDGWEIVITSTGDIAILSYTKSNIEHRKKLFIK